MTRIRAGSGLLVPAAGAAAIIAVPAPALACSGECATQASPFLGTLLAVAGALWLVARVAAWLRGRHQARRLTRETVGGLHEEAH